MTLDRMVLDWFMAAPDSSSPFFRLVLTLADDELLKGGVLMGVFWALWLGSAMPARRRHVRHLLLVTLLGSFAAIALARLLAVVLPFRDRPFNEVAVGQAALPLRALEGWSAFPSDHAALFFGLATGIALVSWRLGALALTHAVVVIAAPRLYLGLHYPSDLVVGAVLGTGCVLVAARSRLVERATGRLVDLCEGWPGVCHGALFIVTFQVATLFDSVRNFARLALATVKGSGWHVTHATVVMLAAAVAAFAIVAFVVALRRQREADADSMAAPVRAGRH